MGRRRTRDKHLPQRVYLDCGTYWFRPKIGKAVNLGRELPAALAKYGELIHGNWSGRTLGDEIDRYRIDVLPLKRSEKTRRNEGDQLTRLKAVFGHIAPHAITQRQLYEYADRRRRPDGRPAPEAARHELGLLQHVYKKAIRWGTATTNPVRGMEKADRKGRRPAVPMSQVEAVRALANERMRVAIDLAVCLGPRRGDLLALRRENLTDAGISFTQGKTRREQLIEWSPDLRAIVARAKALKPQVPGDYLLRTREGKPYTDAGFSAIWQRLMAKHVAAGGQRFTFHDLRSVSADGAETLEEARDRLGHASAETTQRFYRRGVQKGKPRS
jgi:integrase